MILCPHCNSAYTRKAGSLKNGHRYKCNDCGRKFQFPYSTKSGRDIEYISVKKTGNTIRFSKLFSDSMGISENIRLSFFVENSILYIFKDPDGFLVQKEYLNKSIRYFITHHYLALKLRECFHQKRDNTFFIKGKVAHEEFISMEIITYKNAPTRKSGTHSKPPNILVKKNHLTSLISSAAQRLLAIEQDEGMLLGKEDGDIFVAAVKHPDAFNITKVKYGAANVSSRAFGMMLLSHFNIDDEESSYRFNLCKESTNFDGISFFKIESFEKVK
jgi:hypothetical protein